MGTENLNLKNLDKEQLRIIQGIIPEGKDTYSTVRGIFSLFLDDGLIGKKQVVESQVVKEFCDQYKRKVINALSRKGEIQDQQNHEELRAAFQELIQLTRRTGKMENYPIKLDIAGGLTEYKFRGSLKELGYFLLELCGDSHPEIKNTLLLYIDTKIENDFYNEDTSVFDIEFSIVSAGYIRVEIDELPTKKDSELETIDPYRYFLHLTDDEEVIMKLLKNIAYYEGAFSLENTLYKKRLSDHQSQDDVDDDFDMA